MLRGPEGGAGESFYVWGRVLAASGALVLSACGGGHYDNIEGAPRPAVTSSSKSPEPVKMAFDYLGGPDRSISVFSGVESTKERHKQLVYQDDEVVTAVCKLSGRMVESKPEIGETHRRSDQWILIEGRMPEIKPQYASAVYTYNYKNLLEKLEVCPKSLPPSK